MAKRSLFPGSNEPLHIFQDETFDNSTAFDETSSWANHRSWDNSASWNNPNTTASWNSPAFQDNTAPMTSHAPMPAVRKPSRRPLGNSKSSVVTAGPNIIVHPPSLPPPQASAKNMSPHKTKSSSPKSRPNFRRGRGNQLPMVSMGPPFSAQQPPTDSLPKKGPYLSTFKPRPQKPPHELGLLFDKENIPPFLSPSATIFQPAVEDNYTNSNGKRRLMDAAPIGRDLKVVKKTKTEELKPPLQEGPSPPVNKTKPALSYAQLIAMALGSAPEGRCTLSQIYKWISNKYPFYSTDSGGWQNSIRHNLSLHKDFKKMERPKDDPGKGSYWYIEPGAECQFFKDKATRKSAPSAENLPVMSSQFVAVKMTPLAQEPCLPRPSPISQETLPPLPMSQVAVEPSSDATEVLLSDDVTPDEKGDSRTEEDPPMSSIYTDLPATMHSSPPVSKRAKRCSGTATPTRYHPGSSVARPPKRDYAAMEDSGYISSLESSVLRPVERVVMSETDSRPRKKMARFELSGRAEDEIARLRSSPRSSPFSPTKGRSRLGLGHLASSPLRQAREIMTMPPLTPVVKNKASAQPVSLVSPGTELTLHRDVYMKILGPHHYAADDYETGAQEEFFHIGDTPDLHKYREYDCPIINEGYDVSQDSNGLDGTPLGLAEFGRSVLNGSPVKKSAQRIGLQRVATTPNVTYYSAMPPSASPDWRERFGHEPPEKFFNSPSKSLQQSPIKATSPAKSGGLLGSPRPPMTPDVSQFLSASIFAPNESFGDAATENVDILKGFQGIGSANGSGSQPAKRAKVFKPPLASFKRG